MADYERGQEVDVEFTASIITQAGAGWVRLQTASTEFLVDTDAGDLRLTPTGVLHDMPDPPAVLPAGGT